ncbi:hypothetical protein N9P26_01530 [Amylibacter sp.]|nr:hypothetical protein [Amylibacter sp.]
MNYFFFSNKDGISSRLEIPKFQNRGKTDPNLRLFSASIKESMWNIAAIDCVEDLNFFYVEANEDNIDCIYFLATLSEVGGENIAVKTLIKYNDFTQTTPDYRANLCVSNLMGGFSSYQSEYPFDMTLRRGSLITSIATLGNRNAMSNTIFIKNIFCEPINEEYFAYLVCKKDKVIKKKFPLRSNETNKINLSRDDFSSNHYIVTKGFLGIPIYLSESKEGHLSFEHTHPPHSNTHGLNRFAHVARLKNELLEIIG